MTYHPLGDRIKITKEHTTQEGEDMKQTVYKVYINGKFFIRTISKELAERTAKSAVTGYGLSARVEEAFEEYSEPTETL